MSSDNALASLPRYVRGVLTPMYTPFDAKAKIDPEGVRSMVKWLRSRRIVSTVFARCGVGRMNTYTCDDARLMIDLVTEAAEGRLGVIIGTAGEFDGNPEHRPDPAVFLRQTIELSQYAQSKGVDAAVLPVPFALAAPGGSAAEVIFDFYAAVSREVNIPIFVYRMPGLPEEYEITPELLARLLQVPNVIGMKYSSTDLEAFAARAAVTRGKRFAFICGAEHAYAGTLPMGIAGVIGGGCNTHPELIYAVQEAFVRGDKEKMAAVHEDVLLALRPWEGMNHTIMAMQYLARKGVKVQPYQRRGGDPYGGVEGEPYPEEVVDRGEKALDEIIGPYRDYIQQRWDGRLLLPGDEV